MINCQCRVVFLGLFLPLFFFILTNIISNFAFAEVRVEQGGKITTEASWYPQKEAFPGQKGGFLHIETRPELAIFSDKGEIFIQPRISGGSSGNGIVDIREGHFTTQFGGADILVGNTILFWGKTESYNPVNVVNATDYSRGLMRGEKRGSPMLSVSWPLGAGQIDFLTIGFVENIYPKASTRERPSPQILKNVSYSGGAKSGDLANAVRWSGYFGDVDFGISWFDGTGKSPRMLLQPNGKLKPDYSRITQAAMDIQYILDASALKMELIHRSGQYNRSGVNESYRAGVIGIEHNFYDIDGSGDDIILIAEYAHDSRMGRSHSGFQNDFTFGARWLWNDVEGTEFLSLLTQDLDNGGKTLRVSFDRRINNQLTFEVNARLPYHYSRDPNNVALKKDGAIIAALIFNF